MEISIIGDGNNANSTDEITPKTNTADVMTPVAEISPERGTFIRLLNRVARGDLAGLPIYGKFKDSGGNDLPVNTEMVITVEQAGESRPVEVSQEKTDIREYNQNDITTQRNVDNVDSVKHVLKWPQGYDKPGMPPHINVNSIDTAYIEMKSASVIDWTESTLIIDSAGVEEHRG
ncbi:hypothetical protein ACFQJC_14495 [Haloferax namakaokahaiae]|uniref:Uncharacterized protein n=1 Tax=Haloferax namakaokahaiae TaxID=1748331 RepID=A0ABD5ZHR2_9EURY